MVAFTPTGPLLSFTAASSPPTAVQAISLNNDGDQQYILTNADPANDCVVGWGDSSAKAIAAASAAASESHCYFLLHSTQIVVTGPRAAFFSGKAVTSTALIYVQNGYGN